MNTKVINTKLSKAHLLSTVKVVCNSAYIIWKRNSMDLFGLRIWSLWNKKIKEKVQIDPIYSQAFIVFAAPLERICKFVLIYMYLDTYDDDIVHSRPKYIDNNIIL
jgi:hypothetical protein